MSHADPGATFTDLVLEVFRLNGRLLATGDRLSAPLGLTSARWQVMGALDGGPLTAAGIGRAMGLARQSVQRTVDTLAAEGILAFSPNPRHRKAKLIELAPAGRALYDRMSALQTDWARQTAAGLDPAALASAGAMLRLLRQRLEQAAGEPDGSEPLAPPNPLASPNHGAMP